MLLQPSQKKVTKCKKKVKYINTQKHVTFFFHSVELLT